MSILIDELEARKNNYIVVADLINLMAEATNSTLYQVVDYLEAHYVNTHLTRFHIDDYYNFDAIEPWLCELGENDAKTTYFLKADVMAFEPITKHGIFKDGSNDLINPYQKNLDDEYLTLDEVSVIISNEARVNCDYDKIRDLARKKKITPCFYFNGYVCGLSYNNFSGLTPVLTENACTEMMTGYFTYRLLVEQISSYDQYITLPHCEVGNEILIHRLLERQGDTNISYGDGLALFESKPQPFGSNESKKFSCISFDEIRFSKRQLDIYITSLANNNTSQDDTSAQNNNELFAKLERLQAENDDLNSRLSTARNTYKQHRNEIKELTEKNEQVESEKAEIIEQLDRVKAGLADNPADSVTHSNTDIQNIKKAAIRQFNRSLAVALIDLDYQSNLRKGDIVNFIIPHMKELAYVLADEQADKARVLTVKYKTIYDTHLQGLEFKQGTQTTKERERVNIDLLFKRQLPVTE